MKSNLLVYSGQRRHILFVSSLSLLTSYIGAHLGLSRIRNLNLAVFGSIAIGVMVAQLPSTVPVYKKNEVLYLLPTVGFLFGTIWGCALSNIRTSPSRVLISASLLSGFGCYALLKANRSYRQKNDFRDWDDFPFSWV